MKLKDVLISGSGAFLVAILMMFRYDRPDLVIPMGFVTYAFLRVLFIVKRIESRLQTLEESKT